MHAQEVVAPAARARQTRLKCVRRIRQLIVLHIDDALRKSDLAAGDFCDAEGLGCCQRRGRVRLPVHASIGDGEQGGSRDPQRATGQAIGQRGLEKRQCIAIASLVNPHLASLDAKLCGPQRSGRITQRRGTGRLSVCLDEFSGNKALLDGAIEFFRIFLAVPTSLGCKQQKGSNQSQRYGIVVPLENTVPPLTPPPVMLPISARTMVSCAEKRLTSNSPRKILPKSGTLMIWQ